MAKIDHQKAARDTARAYVREFLERHPCTNCGRKDYRVLQFHHRNPAEKTYTIGFMVGKGMRPREIKIEMSKCDVMCSNCHIIHHYEEREFNESVKRAREKREFARTGERRR